MDYTNNMSLLFNINIIPYIVLYNKCDIGVIENYIIIIELDVIFISIIILKSFRVNFYGKIIDKIPKNMRILKIIRVYFGTKRLKKIYKKFR